MSSDLRNSFWLIKLRSQFKDETCIKAVNQPFKIKNKETSTSKETHHTISTCIDLVENDINALIKEQTKKNI